MVRTILAQDRILHIKTHPPTPVSVTPPATPERPLRANPHRPIWGQRVRQPGCTLGRNLGVAGLGPHGQLAPPPPPCTCFAALGPSSIDGEKHSPSHLLISRLVIVKRAAEGRPSAVR